MTPAAQTRRELSVALEQRADILAGFLLQKVRDHARTEHIMQDVEHLHLLLETSQMLQTQEHVAEDTLTVLKSA